MSRSGKEKKQRNHSFNRIISQAPHSFFSKSTGKNGQVARLDLAGFADNLHTFGLYSPQKSCMKSVLSPCPKAKNKCFTFNFCIMNTLSFPQITVSYKDADASKRVKIHSSKESYDIFKTLYEDCMQHHEECWAMYLNRAGKLLGVSCISRSGMDCTVVDIRIVLQTALVSHASGIILSHNHPSGSTVASTPDNNLTSQLKKGCEAIGIQLLDHIILTEDKFLSYADEGML